MTTLAAAVAGSIAPFQPSFNRRENKVSPARSYPFGSPSLIPSSQPWRILFFLGICFTALAPLTHLALQHGAGKMLHFAGMGGCASALIHRLNILSSGPVLTSCAAYVLGLTFYATHFPECKWPGKFDYIGHSHQASHCYSPRDCTNADGLRNVRYGTCASSSQSSCTTGAAYTSSNIARRCLAHCRGRVPR